MALALFVYFVATRSSQPCQNTCRCCRGTQHPKRKLHRGRRHASSCRPSAGPARCSTGPQGTYRWRRRTGEKSQCLSESRCRHALSLVVASSSRMLGASALRSGPAERAQGRTRHLGASPTTQCFLPLPLPPCRRPLFCQDVGARARVRIRPRFAAPRAPR